MTTYYFPSGSAVDEDGNRYTISFEDAVRELIKEEINKFGNFTRFPPGVDVEYLPEWQPIENAPKIYLKNILVWKEGWEEPKIGYWEEGNSNGVPAEWRVMGFKTDATHWMLLPLPPQDDDTV